MSYKDIIEIMSTSLSSIGVLSLSETPHFTTIQKFSERIDKGLIGSVFNQVLKFFTESLGNRMIVFSTGYSVNYHSYYYDKRLDDLGGRLRKSPLKRAQNFAVTHAAAGIAHTLSD